MKTRNSLINLGLTFSLLFCLGFVCNSGGDDKSGAAPGGETTPEQTTATQNAQRAVTGVGAKYGARDPHACGNKASKSAPSVEEAKASFICNTEQVFGSNLYLVEDVAIQVGRGRAYNPNEDINVPNIDTGANVYPIRGSFKQYQCGVIYQDRSNEGKNCNLSDNPRASGLCYKTMWGDWVCQMVDTNGETKERDIAPPK